MPDTHENTARTWRDLADQLTVEQIADLLASARQQRRLPFRDSPDESELLLEQARSLAAHNLNDALMAHMPVPDGAVSTGQWRYFDDADMLCRLFGGTKRDIGGVDVEITGVQFEDGTVTRDIEVHGTVLTAEQARELAEVLCAAVEEIERRSI
jgi:hypothetical protein